ncbi:RagB/SusD family nutrient uptake outer membrane protein [Chitinophaga arvensicola]|uniref:Starch-binding associating with outer membrane n=1 Tax=Chitinophaga arvensicola TaxID=29529 RepID=A0A1I0S8T4_9BACT|nr:RagB/SusD family nutrient uptake outer membrane protein [Chitinophaga arvensicola]SEW52562.1 Starch-binding associating with outer membrane [Chitinophaga arvensicola]
MKKFNFHCYIIALLAVLSGCSKYLDVKPETSVLADEAYNTESGFMEHLNGIYLTMADQKNYGGTTNMVVMELLGQRYYQGTGGVNAPFKTVASFSYDDSKTQGYMSAIWSGGYTMIANLNLILDQIDRRKDVFTGNNYRLVKGQALALRTFLYFDLLRTFGPVYKSADSTQYAIPYYSSYSKTPKDYMRANNFMDSLLRDNEIARKLLVTPDSTTAFNKKMNYYAATTLQARMFLYRGNKPDAFACAKEVIQAQPALYPFNGSKPTDAARDPALSGDVVFCIQNQKLINSYNTYFSYVIPVDWRILYPKDDRLNLCYENNSGDVRMSTAIWNTAPDGSYSFKLFFKYAKGTMVPVIRASECYLIAAETSPDMASGWTYLNTIREARNAMAGTTGDLQIEIGKEYAKEFFGEGQLFFYYKRTFAGSIPDCNNSVATAMRNMTAKDYVVPVPRDELVIHTPGN